MNLLVGFYAENFFWSSCAFEEDLPNEFFQNDLSEYVGIVCAAHKYYGSSQLFKTEMYTPQINQWDCGASFGVISGCVNE